MKRNKIVKWVDGIAPQSSDGASARHFQWQKKIKKRGMKLIAFIVLLLSVQTLAGQENSLNVQVVDPAGKPIAGAQIELLALPDAMAVTSSEGNATFNVVPEGLMKISYQSMVKVVPVTSSDIQVRLDYSDKKIQLGFGKEQEVDQLTSSIDVVYSDQLEKSSAMNPEESLYGQLSGLSVLQNGGEPWNRRPDMFRHV